MNDKYNEIMQDTIDTGSDLSGILSKIEEGNEGRGAMLLDYVSFSVVYRYIQRYNERYNRKILRLMVTLTASEDEDERRFENAVSEVGYILKNTLRRSDVIVQHSPNQFIVLLLECTDQNFLAVFDRVLSRWSSSRYHDSINIEYVTTST